MVSSKAATVEEYLQELPPERQAVLAEVRETIRENLPAGYTETMNWGMISYEIPLDVYPDTYNGQPLSYVALAAQKNHYAVYMSGVYQDPKQEKILLEGFEKIGKKPDMGKSCVRFRKLENIPLEVIGQLIASTPPEKLIAIYEESRN